MNVLDKLASVIDMPDVKKGFMPDKPDRLIALFEYSGRPPDHAFGCTDITQSVQVRTRGISAYADAEAVASVLNRYFDGEISVIQSTPVLDIGYDNAQRQEYTVNFEIRRY
jgi:hypothetical protein